MAAKVVKWQEATRPERECENVQQRESTNVPSFKTISDRRQSPASHSCATSAPTPASRLRPNHPAAAANAGEQLVLCPAVYEGALDFHFESMHSSGNDHTNLSHDESADAAKTGRVWAWYKPFFDLLALPPLLVPKDHQQGAGAREINHCSCLTIDIITCKTP
ncbi:hypothetical protein FB451DRAFT_1560256, partial [Mycena latifolia]